VDFFLLLEAAGVGDSFSLSLEVDFFFGDVDFSGVAVGFGVGDFSAVVFFFVRLRGVGVGVGAKTFFSVVLNDSAAGVRTAIVVPATIPKRTIVMVIVRCIGSANEPLLFRQLGQHGFVQPNPAFQILEWEVFVRRMSAAIG
jgi:hypothetical protein